MTICEGILAGGMRSTLSDINEWTNILCNE